MKRWQIGVGLLLLAAVAGALWWRSRVRAPHVHEPTQVTTADERRILYWYDPMVPDKRFDKPGKSPFMDMQLVPKYAEDDGSGVISIDPRMAQNLGVRTAPVERRSQSAEVHVVGSVAIDETRMHSVEVRAPGWVEELKVRAVGDPVRRGQRIAGIYSPDLYAAQSELVLAATSGDSALLAAARQRLSLLGLPEGQIREVLESGRPQRHALILAPADGVVTELNVRQGQQTSGSVPMLSIADLSRVWIIADVPESQAAAVHVGDRAKIMLRAAPGKEFDGEIAYLYPELQVATRTMKARIVVDNPHGELRPGMFAEVTLAGKASAAALRVPSEAVIRTGTRSVVIVEEGAGEYRPVVVAIGEEVDESTTILSGVEEGQKVVVSGQFLLDSEASLQGAFDRLDPGKRP
ncbi:MAG: efflux RND transporter periplasmic adaptor subunit [Steroidobacteraceae bacterium]